MQPIIIPAADMRPQDLAEIAAMHEPRRKPADDHIIGRCPFCVDGIAGREHTPHSNDFIECDMCDGQGNVTPAVLRKLRAEANNGTWCLNAIWDYAREGQFDRIREWFRITDEHQDPQDVLSRGAD